MASWKKNMAGGKGWFLFQTFVFILKLLSLIFSYWSMVFALNLQKLMTLFPGECSYMLKIWQSKYEVYYKNQTGILRYV